MSKLPQDIRAFLQSISMNHRGCEDGWYACPMSKDYISHDDNDDKQCDCWCGPAKALLEKYKEAA